MTAVVDASPLIALARVGRLDLLCHVFERVLIPDAVAREIVESGSGRQGAIEVADAAWLQKKAIHDTALARLLRQNLGAGEAEAIVLARETEGAILLMDERRGRAAAERLGLEVTGLVGVLIEARELGLLPDGETVMNKLRDQAGFWISDDLRQLVIRG